MTHSFLKLIDFVIIFLNGFNNSENSGNQDIGNPDCGVDMYKFEDSNGSYDDVYDDRLNFTENLVGINEIGLEGLSFKSKINEFFRNDGVFEELERKYLSDSSSNFSGSSRPTNIFSSLNIENGGGDSSESEANPRRDHIDWIRERLIAFILNTDFFKSNRSDIKGLVIKSSILILFVLFLTGAIIAYFLSLEFALAFLLMILSICIFIFNYPKMKKRNDYSSFSKELPYALRQLATELRSGKSLFDSIESIVASDYGILSLEFSRVLEEIKYGETTENAFLNLEKRVGSQALSRVIYEILTSLRVGANLSSSLTIIADDVNFDIRMKLKEYSEKLNAFIMIYTFLAILAPVILLTMLLAASVVIGDLVPEDLVLILYGVFFPMIILFLGFSIKRLEPKI